MTKKHHKPEYFGHLFQSEGAFYYYEASSQEIIFLDPVMAAVLPYFEQIQDGNIPSHFRNNLSPDSVAKAMQAIEKARVSDDLFSRQRPLLVPATDAHKSTSKEFATNLQHLVLTLTENCNLRCHYCLHGASLDWVRSHGKKTMTVDTALKATRYFMERCCREEIPAVSFYGGEALLQMELIQAVVKEVRSHPQGETAHLVIDTNGVLLDEAVINFVVENKMHLQVSLDGPRKYHDRQRTDGRGEGTYDRILQALDRLLEKDPTATERLSFICTVAPPVNLIELDEYFGDFPLYKKFGIHSHPNLQVNLANLNGQQWPATMAEIKDLSDQLGSLREFYFQEITGGRRDELGPVVKSLVEPSLFRLHHRSKAPISEYYTPGGNCRPGVRKLHATADGRLQPCERTGDFLELGRVEGGIEAAAVQNLQTGFFAAVEEKCADCWALRLCGVCYAVWAEHGDDSPQSMIPDSVCNSVRTNVEQDLKLLVRILELPTSLRAYLDEVVIS